MPSVMTLEGPRLAALPAPTDKRLVLFVLGSAALLGVAWLFVRHDQRRGRRELRGPEMLKIIAAESRTPEEFARRADAWNSAERDPLPATKLAKAYRKASPAKVAKLIREAREAREEGRERLWSRMSKGLRGGNPLYYLSYREALKRAKRLAAQTGGKIRVAIGEDARAPGRPEYVVAETGNVPTGFTVVAFADPSGNIESSGSRHHRMMKRRGLDGYKIGFLDRGRRDVSTHTIDDLSTAIREMKLWKRRGFTAWVEDDAGNFVPVKGAMKQPGSL